MRPVSKASGVWPCSGQCGLEVRSDWPVAASSPRHRAARASAQGWALASCVALEFGRRLGGLLAAAEAEVDLDQFRHRRQVDIEDAARAEHGPLLLEMGQRGFGTSEAELQVAERGDGPHLAHAQAQFARQAERLGGVPPALLRPALPGLEPGQAGQRRGEVGALAGLPGQVDRFVKPGLGFGPAVGSGLIERHVAQQEGQHADRGLCGAPLRARGRQAPARCSPPAATAGPWPPRRAGAGSSRSSSERSSTSTAVADGRRAALTFTREDQRHALRDQREEGDPAGRRRAGRATRPAQRPAAW